MNSFSKNPASQTIFAAVVVVGLLLFFPACQSTSDLAPSAPAAARSQGTRYALAVDATVLTRSAMLPTDTFFFPDAMIWDVGKEHAVEIDHATLTFYRVNENDPNSRYKLHFHAQITSWNRYVTDNRGLKLIVIQMNEQGAVIGELEVGSHILRHINGDNYTRNDPHDIDLEVGPEFSHTSKMAIRLVGGVYHG